MKFGERIRNRRKQLGYTLDDIAELTGISSRTIRTMETENYKSRLENWVSVLDKLGLEFEIKIRPISYEEGESKIQ